MSTNIQIDFSDVSAFKDEIKSFNTSLNTLKTNTASFATNIDSFGASFGKSRDIFKELKDNVQGVDVIFRGIASAMSGIAKIPNLDTQIGEFNKFIDGIKRLDASGTATVKNITSITNAFSKLATLQGKGTSFNLEPIIASIHKLIQATSTITNLDVLAKDLAAFTKSLTSLSKVDAAKLANIGTEIANGLKGSVAVDAASEFGTKIADAIIKATKDGLGIASPSLEFIQIGLQVVQGLAKGISQNPELVTTAAKGLAATLVAAFSGGAFQVLLNTFKAGKFIKDKRSSKKAPVAEVKDTVKDITDIINAIGNIPTISPTAEKSFKSVAKTITDIVETFSKINNVSGKSSKKNDNLVKLLSGIQPFMQLINESLSSIPHIDPKLASSFKDIFKTIFSILNVFKDDIPEASFGEKVFGTRLTKYLRGILPFTELLNEALRNLTDLGLGGANSVRAAATTIRSLRDIISELSKLTDDRTLSTKVGAGGKSFEVKLSQISSIGAAFYKNRTALTRFLTGIKPFTKLLADALKNFKDLPPAETLRSVSVGVEAIGDVISVLSALGKDTRSFSLGSISSAGESLYKNRTALTRFFTGIRPLTKLLADAINNFKKVKVNPAILNGVALFIQGLNNILGTIARNDINEGNVKKIGNVIKIISEALAQGISSNLTLGDFSEAGEKSMKAYFGAVEKEAEIKSPSKRMIRVATDIYNGFHAGISKTFSGLKSLGSSFFKAFIGGLSFIKDAFSKLFGGILQNVRQFGQQVTQSFATIASNLRNTAKGLVSGGLATIGTGGFASFLTGNLVTLTASFDSVITTIGVFGKITGDTLSQVQDDILKFSAVTKFGPAESAQAFLDLQKAGLGVAESLKTLPAVGAFATAGQIDLANATTLALTSMNGFGLGIKDINTVIDTFVGGADISTAGVTELANALGFVAPSANALSISIQDTTAALALLNDQAISGERAGTGLRAVLDALAAPTDEAKKTLDSLGISLTDNNGNFVGLSSTISQFSVAIKELRDAGAGDVEIIEQLSSLGDRNAISTLLALIKEGEGTMTQFADGTSRASTAFDDYRKNLENANKAQDVAAQLAETVQAKIESLKGSIEVLIINAFQPLLKENIAPIVDGLIAFFNRLSKLPKPILKFGAALVATTAILTTLAGVVSVFVGLLIFSVIPALQLAGTVFTVFFNPATILATGAAILSTFAIATPVILAFGSAIALVGGILYKLYSDIKTNTGGARDSFNKLGESFTLLKDTFFDLYHSAKDFFNAFLVGSSSIGGAVDKLNSSGGVSGFLDTIRSGVDKITEAMGELKLLFDFFTSQQLTSVPTDGKTINDLTAERTTLQEELNEKLKNGAAFQGAFNRTQEDYLIKSGDTLTAISKAFDVTIADILAANPEITDPNLIFAGKTIKIPGLDTTAPSEDIQKLRDELVILDAEITQQSEDQLLRIAKGQDSVIESQEQALTQLQAKSLSLFKESNLFKRLFGDDDQAVFRAVNTVGKLETIFKGISKSVSGVSKGFNSIFSGKFKSGIKQVVAGFSGIAFQATNLFETITGVDISDELQKNLSEGNLRAIFDSAVSIIGNGIKNMFIAAAPFIIQAAGYALTTFLKSFGSGIRLAGNLLGIDFVNSFFGGLDTNVIQPVVSKFIETLTNIFKLGQGEISLSKFIIDLFGIDELGDKVGVVAGINDIKVAVDELKGAFSEFLTESGLNQIDLRRVSDDIVYFQKNVLPDIVVGALHTIADALHVLAEALIIAGPLVRLYVDSISKLFKSLQLASQDIDADKLKDVGIALGILSVGLTTMGVALGILSLAPLLAIGGTILLIASGFLALYIAFNVLSSTIDPILNFLQDIGDLAQDLAHGNFGAALGELRELFVDIGEIIKGVGTGSVDSVIGLLKAIERLADIDLTIPLAFCETLKELLNSDKSLGELLNIDFDPIFLNIELGYAKLKLAVLNILKGFGETFTGLINGIIDVINGLPLGDDVEPVVLSTQFLSDVEQANAELDKLENRKVNIEANVQLESGILSEGAVSTINSGDTAKFGSLLKSFFEKGFSEENVRTAFADATQSGAVGSNALINGLISSVASNEITPEQAANLIPTNLISAFQEAVRQQVSTGQVEAGSAVSGLLPALFDQEQENLNAANLGKLAGQNVMVGFEEGVNENVQLAKNASTTAMEGVKAAISSILETHSPSLFTFREGLNLVLGLQQGIQQNLFLAFDAVRQLTGTLGSLKQGVVDVQLTITNSFAIAAASMSANVLIMQAAIERLIISLYGLNYAASVTLGTLGAVTGATSGGGGSTGTTTTTGSTTTTTGSTTSSGKGGKGGSVPPPITPGFAATRTSATSGLTDMLKKTLNNRNVGRVSANSNGESSVVITYGNITINNANPNYKMTPDDIAKGLRLHEEQNPPSRKMRNRL